MNSLVWAMSLFRRAIFASLSSIFVLIVVAAGVMGFARIEPSVFDGTPIGEVLSKISKRRDSLPAPLAFIVPIDPCQQEILYSIGSIDSRFHLSHDEFLLAIREADSLWEVGIGMRRFSFVEEGGMPINLVFDERQAGTDSLKNTSSSIESGKAGYDQLSASYGTLRKTYEEKRDTYEKLLADFSDFQASYNKKVTEYNTRLTAYEKDAAEWNSAGGSEGDEATYKQLLKEKQYLDDERTSLEKDQKRFSERADDLKDSRKAVNRLVEELNTLGGTLNRVAASLNLKVNEYNTIVGSREEFTTGLYSEDGSGRRINVFQFSNHEDLVRILAHEMGHALGLGHGTNPESIMYPEVGTQPLRLSGEDIGLYRTVCRE